MSTAISKAGDTALAHQPSMLETVMRAVQDPTIDPARLREFLEIGKELEAREARKQFSQAIAELQPELPHIAKNGLIVRPPSERSKGSTTSFAKWDDVYRACMPLLSKHGLTCSFSSELQGGSALRVSMTVKHIGGHQEESALVVPWQDSGGSKSPAQAAASSFTLAQRHVFVKYFNVLTEDQDDDGSGRGVPEVITEDQAMQIDDAVSLCSEKDPKMRTSFLSWLKKEYNVEGPRQLFQGDQLNAVKAMLKAKMDKLGIGA